MIGIVLVSHSETLARGVLELTQQMVQDRVPIAVAAGTDNPDEPIGTDPMQVMAAIETVYSDDGVLVLMDLGSALMSAEAAIEFLDPEKQDKIYLCEAPLVEGGIAAAVTAAGNASIEQVIVEARGALLSKLSQLEPLLRITPETTPKAATDIAANTTASQPTTDALTLTVIVPNALGLHARPAAKLVGIANDFTTVQIQITKDNQQANARSVNQVATLGARQGDRLTIRATGKNAQAALDAITTFTAENFGDPIGTEAATQPSPQPTTPPSLESIDIPNEVRGIPASGGIAIGPVLRHEPTLPQIVERSVDDIDEEKFRLWDAIAMAQMELNALQTAMQQTLSTAEAEILDAHKLILQDPELLAAANSYITAQRVNAEAGWQHALDHTMDAYRALSDPYLAARADDVKDVGHRVLLQLAGVAYQAPIVTDPSVLVIHELTPSDTAGLSPDMVLGIVTECGGATGHSAILARALGIPAVVGAAGIMNQVVNGQTVTLNGNSGRIQLTPSDTQIAAVETKRTEWLTAQTKSVAAAQSPAITTDGKRIEIGANIGAATDAERAVEFGAEGVGLFRTEFLFMGRGSAPTEDEQAAAYTRAAEAFAAQNSGEQSSRATLVIRTLDVGGDKPIPYLMSDKLRTTSQKTEVEQSLPTEKDLRFKGEENPFLGWRGLRFCLEQPAIFSTQLCAILRASATHSGIRIMFPMVSTLGELRQAKQMVQQAKDELTRKQIAFNQSIEIGIMIEVPSAVMMVDQFAAEVDFFSIGTNDLTQYLLAADRGNARVAGLVNALDPAVLRAIAQVTKAAHEQNIWVGICGEMAGNVAAIPLLVGLGLDELSMSAPSIPAAKEAIRTVDSVAAAKLAEQAFALSSAQEIENFLLAKS